MVGGRCALRFPAVSPSAHPLPGTSTTARYRPCVAVMNRLRRSSLAPGEVRRRLRHADHAQQRAARSNTWMPPGPQQYRFLRCRSSCRRARRLARPDGSAHTLPPPSVPSARTSNTRTVPRSVSLTNSRRSSSEKHSPFGCAKSSASSVRPRAVGVDAVDAAKRQLRRARHAVVLAPAVGRVGEVDRAVAPHRRRRSGCSAPCPRSGWRAR